MKIQELFQEGIAGAIGSAAKAVGTVAGAATAGAGQFVKGATGGQGIGGMALRSLGLNNTANARDFNKLSQQGGNPQQMAQSLSLKPGAQVDFGNGQKNQIKTIDQKGITFADGTIWGPEKLATLAQQQQALQSLGGQVK